MTAKAPIHLQSLLDPLALAVRPKARAMHAMLCVQSSSEKLEMGQGCHAAPQSKPTTHAPSATAAMHAHVCT